MQSVWGDIKVVNDLCNLHCWDFSDDNIYVSHAAIDGVCARWGKMRCATELVA